MPATIKHIQLLRKAVENRPGVLASALEPFATDAADLQVVMGYCFPGESNLGRYRDVPGHRPAVD